MLELFVRMISTATTLRSERPNELLFHGRERGGVLANHSPLVRDYDIGPDACDIDMTRRI
jgi:hypothetical protein